MTDPNLQPMKLHARNLTARAAAVVRGNPVTTRPEDGVENCFPGLEFDQRNLNKVFLPGLSLEWHHGGGVIVRDFDARIRQAAKDAGVEFLRGRVHSVRSESNGLSIRVETQRDIILAETAHAVDATGRSSLLARRLGARREKNERLVAHLESRTAGMVPSHFPDWLEVWGEDGKWRYGISGPGARLETWAISSPERASQSGLGPRVDASSP